MILWIILLLTIVLFVYHKLRERHNHWSRMGVKQRKQIYVIGDSGYTLFKVPLQKFIENIYNQFKNERVCGIYQFMTPTLVINDLELIKDITIKDFDHFTDHMIFMPDEPLWTKNLFALKGQVWREMRATLSPAFTSSKMKAMFCLMDDCAKDFVKQLNETNDPNESLDIKDLCSRYATDVIATCAWGVQVNSLKDKNNEFFEMGKLALDFSSWRLILKIILFSMIPKVMKFFNLKLFNPRVRNFFRALIDDTIETRERNNIIRPDMIHLLMEARKGRLQHIEDNASTKETGFATVEESQIGIHTKSTRSEITNEDITAQALIFFFGGFESVSSLMAFIAYELALNPEIQQRLHSEVEAVFENHDGQLSYDSLTKMTYMDMVVSEVLRLWPNSPFADRVCVKPYTIKAKKLEEKDVNLEIDDLIWLPIWAIHHDEQYFRDPEKFDPERFNEENRKNIKPCSYFPFGLGPRNCIASRFALMEVKTIFCHILRQFEFVVTEKTVIPIVMPLNSFTLPAKRLLLALKKIN